MYRDASMEHLPPVAALRALETAARHRSFTKAAAELHVTQSAISHQIRHLEKLWGLALFQRGPRRVSLTEAGQSLAPVVREFFERLTATLEGLRAEEARGPLRVNLTQSFAVTWLVPRMGSFRQAHPEIDLWISTDDRLIDFATDDVDLTIWLGTGARANMHSTLLLRESVFPVCSPRLLERLGRPATPSALRGYPLLLRIGEERVPNWQDWFERAGVGPVELDSGPSFPDTGMAVQAALDGQGIALARSAHVGDDLASGRLVRLFDVHCPSNLAYYAACPKGTETRPKVAAFCDWLLREASLAQAQYDQADV